MARSALRSSRRRCRAPRPLTPHQQCQSLHTEARRSGGKCQALPCLLRSLLLLPSFTSVSSDHTLAPGPVSSWPWVVLAAQIVDLVRRMHGVMSSSTCSEATGTGLHAMVAGWKCCCGVGGSSACSEHSSGLCREWDVHQPAVSSTKSIRLGVAGKTGCSRY